MSRTITISTAVFAAIWANHREGEETEDAILRRLLDCGNEGKQTEHSERGEHAGGIYDTRNGVHFPEGFEIFRNYMGREYRAAVWNGAWVREDTGQQFPAITSLTGPSCQAAKTCRAGPGSTAQLVDPFNLSTRCAVRTG